MTKKENDPIETQELKTPATRVKFHKYSETSDLGGCAPLQLPNRVGPISIRSSCLGKKHEIDITQEAINMAKLEDKKVVIEFPDGEKNLIVFD